MMVSFPYYSHTTPIRIPKDMGIVWEAYHKGVPLLGVPGITLDTAPSQKSKRYFTDPRKYQTSNLNTPKSSKRMSQYNKVIKTKVTQIFRQKKNWARFAIADPGKLYQPIRSIFAVLFCFPGQILLPNLNWRAFLGATLPILNQLENSLNPVA